VSAPGKIMLCLSDLILTNMCQLSPVDLTKLSTIRNAVGCYGVVDRLVLGCCHWARGCPGLFYAFLKFYIYNPWLHFIRCIGCSKLFLKVTVPVITCRHSPQTRARSSWGTVFYWRIINTGLYGLCYGII